MLSDVCEQEEHETCFENEWDGCRCACHPDPPDCLAGFSRPTTEKPSTGGARQAHDAAGSPVLPPPASAIPRRASAGQSTPARAHPRAGVDPQDRATGPVPAVRVSPPGPLAEPAGPGTSSAPPSERQVARTPGPETAPALPVGQAAVRARVKTPAGASACDSPPAGSRGLSAGQLAIAAAMSEDRGPDSLDAHVRRLMADLGLRGYHTHDSRRSRAGFPDWTITGRRTIFRELKTQRGKVSAAQQEWLDALTEAGDDADVWRPADLLTGQIARELTAISKLARAVAWTA